jgi:hypothetical protein
MNSDLMPSPESSNSTASEEALNSSEAAANINAASPPAAEPENAPDISTETANDENLANRLQPIPPPSEPMQYRAIGLVRGRYVASSEQFTQGTMLTSDGAELDAVLLGRIMSLVKNHLDLEKEHLWVVYPRTRQENDKLHIQIVGVWEPENLAKPPTADDEQDSVSIEPTANTSTVLQSSSELPDGGFSVRGEVVYQSFEAGNLVIKIRQAARKQDDKPKYFKLKIKGKLEAKAVGKFWDLQVKREVDELIIESGEAIAELPRKRRPPQRRPGGGGGGRRPSGKKPFPPRQRNGETPRPVRKTGEKTGDSPTPARPVSTKPMPKPVKRPKPPEQ